MSKKNKPRPTPNVPAVEPTTPNSPLASSQVEPANQSSPEAQAKMPSLWSDGPNRKLSLRENIRDKWDMIAHLILVVSALRLFVGEAYLIPSGSMATTLYGSFIDYQCPSCGHKSSVDARAQAEGGAKLFTAECQNCGLSCNLQGHKYTGGNRIVVPKLQWPGFMPLERWEVVVFKCPDDGRTVQNYIKRLVGMPDETIDIRYGDIRVSAKEDGPFKIARKPLHAMIGSRRLVDDASEYPSDWPNDPDRQRWQPKSPGNWTIDRKTATFRVKPTASDELFFTNYTRDDPNSKDVRKRLICDFESYNTDNRPPSMNYRAAINWVGDLMVETTLTSHAGTGEATLILREGTRQFICKFDLAKGTVEVGEQGKKMNSANVAVKGAGTWNIRFANVDDRLALWIDDGSIQSIWKNAAVFPAGIDVDEPTAEQLGPTYDDITPISLLAQGGEFTFAKMKVFRDTYYTRQCYAQDLPDVNHGDPYLSEETITRWRDALRNLPPRRFAVPKDAYFTLGDNSQQSVDAREWSAMNYVPERMMLGRAILVFWPLKHWKIIK